MKRRYQVNARYRRFFTVIRMTKFRQDDPALLSLFSIELSFPLFPESVLDRLQLIACFHFAHVFNPFVFRMIPQEIDEGIPLIKFHIVVCNI